MLTQIKKYAQALLSTALETTLSTHATLNSPYRNFILGTCLLCIALNSASLDYSTLWADSSGFFPEDLSQIISTSLSSLLVTLAVLCGISMPLAANPIHSLMYLLALFVTMAIAYLSVGQEYLAMVFLIVYIGAISILFLFVIMLIGVKFFGSAIPGSKRTERIVGAYCLVLITLGIYRALNVLPAPSPDGDTSHFVYAATLDVLHFAGMYNEHWSLFGMITIILLITMLGAIIVGTNGNDAVVISRPKKFLSAATPAIVTAGEVEVITCSSSVPTELSAYIAAGAGAFFFLSTAALLSLILKNDVSCQRILKSINTFRKTFPWTTYRKMLFSIQVPAILVVYLVCPFEACAAQALIGEMPETATVTEMSEAALAAEMSEVHAKVVVFYSVEYFQVMDEHYYNLLRALSSVDITSEDVTRIKAEVRALETEHSRLWREVKHVPGARDALSSVVDGCRHKDRVINDAITEYRDDRTPTWRTVARDFPELTPASTGDEVSFEEVVAGPVIVVGAIYYAYDTFKKYEMIYNFIRSFWP